MSEFEPIEVEEEMIEVRHRWTEDKTALVQQTSWPNGEGAAISIAGPGVLTPTTLELSWDQIELLKAVLD
ncbi:hypothetical protein IT774_07430 [Salinimonas marina]|uniref:Uncharacterized protein n=1 Tax=Salinimonas marina TaxID=2785918 RepID=A0A7S9DZR4_9ALTE|nr:hypothetical protein [Salinimonas marina]QPG06926.1 hypothetical protein IT774_07430 [Salinimonas marina]